MSIGAPERNSDAQPRSLQNRTERPPLLDPAALFSPITSRSDEMLVAPGSPHAHVANLERRKRFYLEGESDRLPFVAPNPEMGGELGFQQETVWEQARERLISTGF